MKKLLSLAIAFILTIQSALAFNDVNTDVLDYLHRQHIVSGYPDGTFRAEATINRAELIKMIMLATDMPLTESGISCFPDVTPSAWYAPYVCAAKRLGVVNGYPDGRFKANNTVNKAEAVKIIAGMLGVDAYLDTHRSYTFHDVSTKLWYARYAYALSEKYYIDWAAKFDAGRSITRGEVTDILFRYMVEMKLYPLREIEVLTAQDPKVQQISAKDSYTMVRADFFRADKDAAAVTLQQVKDAQVDYPGVISMQSADKTYAVFNITSQERELPLKYSTYLTFAVLAFDTRTGAQISHDIITLPAENTAGSEPSITQIWPTDKVGISIDYFYASGIINPGMGGNLMVQLPSGR